MLSVYIISQNFAGTTLCMCSGGRGRGGEEVKLPKQINVESHSSNEV